MAVPYLIPPRESDNLLSKAKIKIRDTSKLELQYNNNMENITLRYRKVMSLFREKKAKLKRFNQT